MWNTRNCFIYFIWNSYINWNLKSKNQSKGKNNFKKINEYKPTSANTFICANKRKHKLKAVRYHLLPNHNLDVTYYLRLPILHFFVPLPLPAAPQCQRPEDTSGHQWPEPKARKQTRCVTTALLTRGNQHT